MSCVARVLCSGRPNLHFTKTVFSSPEDGVGALEPGGRPTGQSVVTQRRMGGLG